jgi:hypothetical protein
MRIEHFRRERTPEGARVTATVVWEEAERLPIELYFEVAGAPGEDLSADPNAFLCACVPAALRDGEKRIFVEGAVCPRLRDGVLAALEILRSWYHPDRAIPAVETSEGYRPSAPRPPRSAFFVSGGADSLFLLWSNRDDYPPDHPAFFRDAIFAEGHSFPEYPPSERARDIGRRAERSVRAISRDAGVELITVRSNYAGLASDIWFIVHEAQSASLGAVAHALSTRITSAAIASSDRFEGIDPWGSHPLLDPQFSSTGVEILHEGMLYSRYDKVSRMREWPVALENMMVCFESPLENDGLNCGKCEKCIRTMTALEAAGCLDRASAFPRRHLLPEDLEGISLGYTLHRFTSSWEPMITPLRQRGREDLAAVVDQKIRQAKYLLRQAQGEGWKRRIRALDRRYLGGSLARLRSRLLTGRET